MVLDEDMVLSEFLYETLETFDEFGLHFKEKNGRVFVTATSGVGDSVAVTAAVAKDGESPASVLCRGMVNLLGRKVIANSRDRVSVVSREADEKEALIVAAQKAYDLAQDNLSDLEAAFCEYTEALSLFGDDNGPLPDEPVGGLSGLMKEIRAARCVLDEADSRLNRLL